MVLPNIDSRLRLQTTPPLLEIKWLHIPVSRMASLCFICIFFLSGTHFSKAAFAQEHDFDFVDSLAPVDASASAFHNEKFGEAERALMEGLSRRGGSEAPSPKQPKMRQVAATQQQTVTQQVPKLVEDSQQDVPNLKRDIDSARSRMNSTGQRPTGVDTQLLSAINAQTAQEVAAPKNRSSRGTPTKAVDQVAALEDAKPAVKSKAVTNRQPEQSKEVEKNQEPRTTEDSTQLRRELADAKSQLAAAELEIARLSAIIQDASRARLALPPTGAKLLKAAPKEELPVAPSLETKQATPPRQSEPVAAPDPNHDLQVATISVDKADLRLGPGRNHSALMSLRRGSRLAVEARQGEWYRVFAPNGQRAWIHSSLVRFGDGASSLNDGSSVTVKGYDSALR